jgi:hypothetical protein
MCFFIITHPKIKYFFITLLLPILLLFIILYQKYFYYYINKKNFDLIIIEQFYIFIKNLIIKIIPILENIKFINKI